MLLDGLEQVEEKDILDNISQCIEACKSKQDNVEPMKDLSETLSSLLELFQEFKNTAKTKSAMFTFWDEYIMMVLIMLQFIKAERNGNQQHHLVCTAEMTSYFHAMDRTNYAR